MRPSRTADARSLLFVPATAPRRFATAATSGADLVVIDLEDAVAASDKALARTAAEQWLSTDPPTTAVRINAVGTHWHAEDAALRERLDRTAADLTVFMIERYGAELTTVITHTIERWDGKEAARRIELHVGRDLQFIRINGTIVGALAGLGIHALSQLAG